MKTFSFLHHMVSEKSCDLLPMCCQVGNKKTATSY
jgi:hypothetical protein